jgi:hypothetical protein
MALAMLTAVFANGSRFEVVAWQEDFESGAPGWSHYDGMGSPNNWHIYDNGDQHGNVWWMGNPDLATGTNIGGYLNSQYLVLDTPARMIDATNATLTFSLRYKVEAIAGATAPYNGWDACNVRYSSNDGPWIPLTGTPAYNMTSSFAFGDEHGEGANIPGWGGAQTAWVNATFDLSAQAGRNVRIRFAFASDPAYDTESDRTMFGMMVDDISFGGYTNNGVDDGQMTWASMVNPGPDLWHIATVTDAPSPTHIMACQNAALTYEPNMMNYLESPSITLPSSGDISVDFMIKSDFTDTSAWPDQEYFGFWISPDNGLTWNYMSNPYADPALDNYVFTGAAAEWTTWSEGWGYEGLISDFAGQTIKLRWVFRADDDTPIGAGIVIDDVKIYNDLFVAPPENLAGVVTGNTVALSWAAPGSGGGGGEPGWLTYSAEPNGNSIGTNGVADFDVAAKWDPVGATNSIYPYIGMNITKIQFVPMSADATYAARIWTGGTAVLAVDQAVTNPVIGQWNEVILTTPHTIQAATQLMAGFRCNSTLGYPAGCDEGPQVEGYGNMMRWNNVWQPLTTVLATATYNWNIKIYVADAAGREYVMGELPQNYQAPTSNLDASIVTRDRDVTAYKVFRNNVLLAEVPGTQLTYTDTNVPGGVQNYTVTALFGTYESLASNVASVFVYPASYVELGYDDGTPELGYNVGPTKRMGVKFTYPHTVLVKNAKVYVHTVGSANMIFHLFDASGGDGMPGVQLAQYQLASASIVQGWNTITWPTEVTIADGAFYITILETANASAIGMDTNSNGHSYKKIGTAWEPVTEGEVMIHAIFDTAVSNEDDVTPVIVLDANNYPNPFNPETTISFALPTSGATSLKIFNLKGQLVRSLVNRDMAAGTQRVVWNGMDDNNRPVSSGLYFYQVSNAGKSITRKMLLAK